jgi:hypothetical protein
MNAQTRSCAAAVPDQRSPSAVSLAQAFRFWLKLGFISFGGPAGQIAIMHQRNWSKTGAGFQREGVSCMR